MFGIGGFYKAYRSLIHKRHSEKNSSPKPEADQEKSKSTDESNKALNDKDHEGRAMNGNGLHDKRQNSEGMQGEDPASSKRLLKNHSANNYFSSMSSPLSRSSSPLSRNPSFSRSTSHRSPTLMPVSAASRFLRSLSRKHADTSEGRGLLSRSSSRKGTTNAFPDTGSLSRSSSRKGTTNAFSPGGSLSRISSQKGSTNAVPDKGSLSKSTSRKGIMYSNSHGVMKPPAIEKNLECTLEELCFGSTKRINVTRDVVTNDGQIVEEEETLTIKVKPGWMKGTKITFEGMGNETKGTHPADIIFVIVQKKHHLFRREGDDLELGVEIPLVKALTGCTISVPLLGGEKMSLTIDDIIHPGYEKIIPGQGMPKSKEEGSRGNLRIAFLVHFPKELTGEQRADVFRILQDSC